MFEVLYKDPATIERYRLAPLVEERERYLRVVVASGVINEIARRVARTQLVLMDLLNLPQADLPISLERVETAVEVWCRNLPAVSAAGSATSWLSLVAFPWLAGRDASGWPSARSAGGGVRGMDAGRSGAVRSNHRQLPLRERPFLCLGREPEPGARRHHDQ